MKQLVLILLSCIIIGLFANWRTNHKTALNIEQATLNVLLQQLGEHEPRHQLTNTSPVLIQKGLELVTQGRTRHLGKKSKSISKHFTCTSCHNLRKETEDLRLANSPSERLAYSYKNNVPFLQGSSFFGIVNRETWYNNDYKKKYGSLVDSARHDLGASIQLCAQECSQGRVLDEWEEEAILAYLWSIEIIDPCIYQ